MLRKIGGGNPTSTPHAYHHRRLYALELGYQNLLLSWLQIIWTVPTFSKILLGKKNHTLNPTMYALSVLRVKTKELHPCVCAKDSASLLFKTEKALRYPCVFLER